MTHLRPNTVIIVVLCLITPQLLAASADPGGGDTDKGTLHLKVMPDQIFANNNEFATFTATLLDENQNPVSDKRINFKVDGQPYVHNDTNDQGKAVVVWPDSNEGANGGDAGHHTVRATVNNNRDDYDPSTDTDGFDVSDGDIILSVKQNGQAVDAVKAGQTVQLDARLASGASGERIEFEGQYYDSDQQQWVDLGTPWPRSDDTGDDSGESSGEAIVSTDLAAKKYRFTAWHDANNDGDKDDGETDQDDAMGVSVSLQFVGNSQRGVNIGKNVCLNAQSEYKSLKGKAIVLPIGTEATITSDNKVTTTRNSIHNGGEFSIRADEIGTYHLTLTHEASSDVKDQKQGVTFQFKQGHQKYVAGGNPKGPGWTSGGTKKKNTISFSYPFPPGTHSGHGSRKFTGTLNLDVEPAGAYTGAVRADVDAQARQTGEIAAVGVAGFTVQGTDVSPLHADAKVVSKVKILTQGSTPVTASTEASAPYAIVGTIDEEIVGGTVTASETDVPTTGNRFPKTVDFVVTASFQADSETIDLGVLGAYDSKSRTVANKDFTVKRGVNKLDNFEIIP